MTQTSGEDELLRRGDDPHRPSLENRVAYQWETGLDTLGYRNATLRDSLTLGWAADALQRSARPASVVDLGCARGNYLLMLNAMLDHDPGISYCGVDIDEQGLAFGRAFVAEVPGYENCEFRVASAEDGLSFEDNSQQVVVANDVVEHLPDVVGVFRDLARVTQPGGTVIISTPLEDSLFKRAARGANRLSGGRLNRSYYAGKGAELDASGAPIMEVHAGHDHISEMTYPALLANLDEAGLRITAQRLMPVMSGSAWFDRHPFLLTSIMGVEAVHSKLQRPSWAHGICLRLTPR